MLSDWCDPGDLHPEPGDKIDFDRGIIYNHVGIADGQGYVYHFGGDGGKKKKNVKHHHERISQVANGSKVRINNTEDNHRNPATRSEILRRAQERQGTGAGTFNALKNNCEHNATDIRYGQAVSQQVSWWRGLGFLDTFRAAIVTVIDTILNGRQGRQRRRRRLPYPLRA